MIDSLAEQVSGPVRTNRRGKPRLGIVKSVSSIISSAGNSRVNSQLSDSIFAVCLKLFESKPFFFSSGHH